MATKLSRFTQLVFGSGETNAKIAKFGSLAAGTPARYTGATITPSLVQSLANYTSGWFGAVLGSNAFAIEDMNALCYLFSFQLAYLMQTGVPEYDAGTTYFIGSVVNNGFGESYVSLTDNNIGNALSSGANWKPQDGGSTTITVSTTLTSASPRRIRSASAANVVITLPTIATTVGRTFIIKDVGVLGFNTSIKGNGTELIDGVNTYGTILQQYESMTVYNNGTSWDVV